MTELSPVPRRWLETTIHSAPAAGRGGRAGCRPHGRRSPSAAPSPSPNQAVRLLIYPSAARYWGSPWPPQALIDEYRFGDRGSTFNHSQNLRAHWVVVGIKSDRLRSAAFSQRPQIQTIGQGYDFHPAIVPGAPCRS